MNETLCAASSYRTRARTGVAWRRGSNRRDGAWPRRARLALAALCALCLAGVWDPARVAAAGAEGESLPEEARYFLELAETAARKGKWGEALDQYAEHLRVLTTRDGRDVRTFRWIFDAYAAAAQRALRQPDWAELQKAVQERVTKATEAKDGQQLWRLQLLLADIAAAGRDEAASIAALEAAVAAYPDLFYPDPAQQASIHHLLNRAALAKAQKDLPAAIAWFLTTFKQHPACVYVDVEPWEQFFRRQGNPQGFLDFYDQLIAAYQAKIADPEKQARVDSLRYFMRVYQRDYLRRRRAR